MKEQISTTKAPGAIGPYSQAIRAGNFVFTSGQIPVNAETGEMPDGVEAQTRQSLKNVEAVLAGAGLRMEDIVKTTVFLSDMNNFAAMNTVYTDFFKDGIFPARSAVEVARLPKDCLVEIEAVALVR